MAGSANRDRAFVLRHRFHIVGGILIAVTVIAAGLSIWDRRQQTVASYQRELTNLSVTLAEQTARSMQAVDLVLQEMQSRIAATAIDSPAELDARMTAADTHRFLADRLAALPQAQGISVIDAQGLMIGSSREWPTSRLDVSDRDYFVFLRDHNDTGVFISTPARSRLTNNWAFFIARRINGRHGEFLGVMLGVIDASYFEAFYQGISLPDGGSVAIFRTDGTLLIRYPRAPEMVGQKLPAGSEWYSAVSKGGGTYRTRGNIGGIMRVASVQPVRDYPVVMAVTVPQQAMLASWRQFALSVSLGSISLILCFGLLIAMLARSARKLERQAAALTASTEALKASESRFRDFALTSSDWFWESDRQHRITYVSEGIRAFGQEPGWFIGRSRIENATPSDRFDEKWQAHLATLARHEPFRNFVFTLHCEDRDLTVSSAGDPVFDDCGEFIGYRGTGRDITAITAGEARLRLAIDRLDRVQRIAHVGSIAVDLRSERIIWSPQACALFGIDLQITESSQEFMLELIHPDDQAAVYDVAQKANMTGTVAPPLEYRIVRPDGTERFVYRENAIETDERGVPVRRVVTYQDITDFKRAEAQLRETMSNLERAQRLAHVGGHVWDLRTRTLTWSAETYRIFGLDPNTFAPSPESILELVIPEDRPQLKARRKAILEGKCPPASEFSVRRPDGEIRRIYSEAEIDFDDAGEPVRWISMHQDITEQRRIEQNLREAKEAAEAANLAKSQFLANMSHELRTPLNAIIGFSELLDLGISGPLLPKQQEYARLIRQSGDHLHRVINDILDLAKVDAGKLELREEGGIDPAQIIDACVQLVNARAKEGGITLSVKTSGQLPLVVADSTRLKQILLNLLSNAVKFTEPGGHVTLAVRRAKTGGITFEVRDTGPGMTEAEIQIALEPFGQIDAGLARRHEGTGLGLPLACRLATLHGGSLQLNSTKGCGTSVVLTLPPERVVKQPRQRVSANVAA